MKGDKQTNQLAVYGTQGIAAMVNKPGARQAGISWTDATGNLWLFGGAGFGESSPGYAQYLNDLWKYTPSTNEWTWVKGDKQTNQFGVYGTQGVATVTNKPGARYAGVTWTDAAGSLWLFGGDGFGESSSGYLNDLWKYTSSTNQWTWAKGGKVGSHLDVYGVYGTQGVAAAANNPGVRYNSASWTDAAGNLWLFGGFGCDESSFSIYLNDLWKYTPSTNQWTWVKGDKTGSVSGIYGTQGIAAAANKPGGRAGGFSWTDAEGNFWLFGGYGLGETWQVLSLNDLWKYTPSTNEWTWVKGDKIGFPTNALYGVYGMQGVAAVANKPGGRSGGVSWKDAVGNLWLFGGTGYPESGAFTEDLNDVWRYNIPTGEWTWMKGDKTARQNGVYGLQGTAAATNKPGARRASASGVDGSGNFWLFGGFGFPESSGENASYMNDLWKYTPPASTLPINLSAVKAYQKGKDIHVEWTARTEVNMDKYEVEKSTDGRQFIKASAVAARGASTTTVYEWLDINANGGSNYYRIKAIGKTGEAQHSRTVKVEIGNLADGIAVYPNPLKNNGFDLSVRLPKGKYTVMLTNALGQTVYKTEIMHLGGAATQTLQPVCGLTRGVYRLSVSDGKHRSVQPLMKE